MTTSVIALHSATECLPEIESLVPGGSHGAYSVCAAVLVSRRQCGECTLFVGYAVFKVPNLFETGRCSCQKQDFLLRAHAGLTARTFQNIVNDIDFGDFVGVSQPDAADFALPQQVIGRMTADAQHGLQILDRYNVRVLRKHELVHFPDFFTIHSITILEF